MKLKGYDLRVFPGIETPGGYVAMQHGAQYSVTIVNGNPTRCDAMISIDGKRIGTWRLNAPETLVIERPSNSESRFTFFRVGSTEAIAGGIVDDDLAGLITVKFIPEMHQPRIVEPLRPVTEKTYRNSGGTTLTGHSDQKFAPAEHIDLDHSSAVTINLRLVPDGESVFRQDLAVATMSTPIPPKLT